MTDKNGEKYLAEGYRELVHFDGNKVAIVPKKGLIHNLWNYWLQKRPEKDLRDIRMSQIVSAGIGQSSAIDWHIQFTLNHGGNPPNPYRNPHAVVFPRKRRRQFEEIRDKIDKLIDKREG